MERRKYGKIWVMEKWYVRNTEGKVFGPIDLDTLKMWVKDGRVEPLAGVSNDLRSWMLAPMKPELEMNWVVENNPGQFYGPTHRTVLDDLVKSGSLSHEARFYQDDRGAGLERMRALTALLSEKEAEMSRREKALVEAQRIVAKKDQQLAAAQKIIAQRDERLAELTAQLAQRDMQIDSLTKTAQTREGAIRSRDAALAQQKAELERAKDVAKAKEAEVADLKEQFANAQEVHAREWETEVVQPEVVLSEMPPPVARQAFNFGGRGGVPAASLAALERQAQQELASMGAADVRRFFEKRM
jgi:hypothetical protein